LNASASEAGLLPADLGVPLEEDIVAIGALLGGSDDLGTGGEDGSSIFISLQIESSYGKSQGKGFDYDAY